jgi:prepilin-type N-terminal cleavage/methylation domain-containing protein
MERRRRACRHPGVADTTRARGFTLLETMLALTIILVGVLSVLQAQRSFIFTNQWSTHAATASYLASEIRELARSLPRHDRFSGGLYFTTPGNPDTLQGWGPEPGETLIGDLDDLDDLDGAVFGDAGTLPAGFTMSRRFAGPINAFGELITETLWDGGTLEVEVSGETVPVSMQGWTQIVSVEKVDAADYSIALADNAAQTGVREVDQYPVRVTVTVLYQGVWTSEAPAITEVSWVIPP